MNINLLATLAVFLLLMAAVLRTHYFKAKLQGKIYIEKSVHRYEVYEGYIYQADLTMVKLLAAIAVILAIMFF